MVPGDLDVFLKELSSATKGDFQFDVEGGEQAASAAPAPTKGKGKGKKKK